MILSNSKRSYTVGNITSVVSDNITFRNDCDIVYDQTSIETLYTNVCDVFAILMKVCPDDHWAIGGTLLGACRHKHIIPWDDDADIATTIKGFNLISKKKNMKLFQQKSFDVISYFCGYKIYKNDIIVCDIFVVDCINDKTMVYSGPIINGRSTFITHDYCFPLIQFKYNHIFPLKRKMFGNIEINCPNKYNIVLYNNYTKNVLNEIIVPNVENFHNNFLTNKTASMFLYNLLINHYEKQNARNFILLISSLIINHNMSSFMNKKCNSIITDKFATFDILDTTNELCEIIALLL